MQSPLMTEMLQATAKFHPDGRDVDLAEAQARAFRGQADNGKHKVKLPVHWIESVVSRLQPRFGKRARN